MVNNSHAKPLRTNNVGLYVFMCGTAASLKWHQPVPGTRGPREPVSKGSPVHKGFCPRQLPKMQGTDRGFHCLISLRHYLIPKLIRLSLGPQSAKRFWDIILHSEKVIHTKGILQKKTFTINILTYLKASFTSP